MSFVRANGLSFHVQEMGEGPPVVMVHGMFLGNLAAWYFLIAPALARNHRVFLYDLRSHGRSEKVTTGFTLAEMTADLSELTAHYDEPLDIVGFSYGALIALRFAMDHPERTKRLVMVETPLPPHSAAETQDLMALSPVELRGVLTPENLRESVLGYENADELLEALPPSVKRNILRGGRGMKKLVGTLYRLLVETSIVQDVRAEPDIPDEELVKVKAPVLAIYGEQSSCRPVGDRMQRVMPDARLYVSDAGHYLINERPHELTEVIEEFLRG